MLCKRLERRQKRLLYDVFSGMAIGDCIERHTPHNPLIAVHQRGKHLSVSLKNPVNQFSVTQHVSGPARLREISFLR